MQSLRILLFAALFCLGGCATLSEADRSALQRGGVSPQLQQRMAVFDPLELSDIMELSQKKISSEFLLRYLRSTAHVYTLDSQDVVLLRQAGVQNKVIDYLMATPSLYAMRYSEPGYRYEPYYYYNRPIVIIRGRHR